MPSSDQILNNLNNGKTYSFSQLVSHWADGLQAGYYHFLTLAAGASVIFVCFGLLILVLGFVMHSSPMKKWGVGTFLCSLAGFGLMVLAPFLVASMKHVAP